MFKSKGIKQPDQPNFKANLITFPFKFNKLLAQNVKHPLIDKLVAKRYIIIKML